MFSMTEWGEALLRSTCRVGVPKGLLCTYPESTSTESLIDWEDRLGESLGTSREELFERSTLRGTVSDRSRWG